MTFVIEGDRRRSGRSLAVFLGGKNPTRLLIVIIVRQRPALEKMVIYIESLDIETSKQWLNVPSSGWLPSSERCEKVQEE
jgi:hypothetical protein